MILWLSSYPKSGNTWIRSFIISLLYLKEGKSDLRKLNYIPQFPMRSHFKNLTTKLDDVHEIKKNWIISQNLLNLDNKIKFLKTHQINCKIDDFEFTNEINTIGVIHIVRDPRNVITSIKNHFHLNTIDDAKEFIFSKYKWTGFKNENESAKDKAAPTLISSWDNHFNSWIKFKKNYLLIKYENLINEPESEFSKIVIFLEKLLKKKFDAKKILTSINSNSFKNLKLQEEAGYFYEGVADKNENKKKFFNLGIKNNWKKLLDINTIKDIENKFSKEMTELKYL